MPPIIALECCCVHTGSVFLADLLGFIYNEEGLCDTLRVIKYIAGNKIHTKVIIQKSRLI